jgi:hypothetical protein
VKFLFYALCVAVLADLLLGMPVKITMADLNGIRQAALNAARSFQNVEYVRAIESSLSVKH